jgi:hypothetical protein
VNARTAEEVVRILVEECGAEPDFLIRYGFIEAVTTSGVEEWQFVGSLGFRGKIWPDAMRVSCYREDETPARLSMIARANERLAELMAATEHGHKPDRCCRWCKTHVNPHRGCMLP